MKRKLTLEVEVDQPEADWLWNAHIENKPIHGVRVLSLGDGTLEDQMHRIEIPEDCDHEYSYLDGDTHEWCKRCGCLGNRVKNDIP